MVRRGLGSIRQDLNVSIAVVTELKSKGVRIWIGYHNHPIGNGTPIAYVRLANQLRRGRSSTTSFRM